MLFAPFEAISGSDAEDILFVNSIFEGFLTKIKVAFLCGIILSLPVHFYNVIRFVFPGLKPKEKQVIGISLSASFILVALSAYYAYYQIIPISIAFLTNTGFIPERVGLLLNYQKNIFYVFRFMLVTLILFQLPIILEVLMVVSLVKRRTLMRTSRFFVVGIFVLSALMTPPDFISQVSVALPLILLFFLTILIAKIFHFGEQ